jgi:hypothetical protein
VRLIIYLPKTEQTQAFIWSLSGLVKAAEKRQYGFFHVDFVQLFNDYPIVQRFARKMHTPPYCSTFTKTNKAADQQNSMGKQHNSDELSISLMSRNA